MCHRHPVRSHQPVMKKARPMPKNVLLEQGQDPTRQLKLYRQSRRRRGFGFSFGDGLSLKHWVYIFAGILFFAWLGSVFLFRKGGGPPTVFAFGGKPAATATAV